MGKATIVVEGVFRAGYEEYFAEYSGKVREYLDGHGAQVVRRQLVRRTLYGAGSIDLIMVIDLPSVRLAEEIFFLPGYVALIPLRNKVFAEFRMFLAEFGEI